MSKETPLQIDLFTGELVDNRSRAQKKKARLLNMPQQSSMFSQAELAQFGVNAHPRIPLSPHTTLALIVEDPRTPEEKADDLRRELEERNYRFELDAIDNHHDDDD